MTTPGSIYFRQAARGSPRSPKLLHPAIWFSIIWLLVLSVWAAVPDETFMRVTGSDRYYSTTSAIFFALTLAAFVVGTLVGPDLLRLRSAPRRNLGVDPAGTVRILGWATLCALAIGGSTLVYILGAGFVKAGGPGAVISEFLDGVPTAQLARSYFISSRVQGLTVWVQFNSAVAALATLGLMLNGGRSGWSRVFVGAVSAGFVLALLQSFAMNDRLATYEYLVVSAGVFAGVRLFRGEPVFTPAVVTRVLLVGAIGAAVWFGGEYGRTYLGRYGPTVQDAEGERIVTPDQPAPSDVAGDSLLAYLLSGPNNAMYAVDHADNYSYLYRTFKALFTTLRLDRPDAPLIGEGFSEPGVLLDEIYEGNLEFTVYSYVGNAYFDLGWGGVLISLWFGLVVGAVYYRFAAGEVWAILIYPFLFVGVLDSWRITYWAESRMMVPILALSVVSFFLYKGAHRLQATRPAARTPATEAVANG